jgi:hypothetical protein
MLSIEPKLLETSIRLKRRPRIGRGIVSATSTWRAIIRLFKPVAVRIIASNTIANEEEKIKSKTAAPRRRIEGIKTRLRP